MTKIIRAFTGPSRLTEDQVEWCENEINELKEEPDEVRTGCADGLDSIAAYLQWFEYPGACHKLYVPAAYHNKKLANSLGAELGVKVVLCPKRPRVPEAYRTRNTMMLDGATILEAFAFSREFYRSGEWMTINIATQTSVPVRMHVIP